MSQAVQDTDRAVGRLDPGPTGRVVSPGDAGWDVTRAAWVVQVDQQPAAVAVVRSATDVAAIVTSAARCGLTVMAQGTGHGALPVGSLTNTVLVRTSAVNSVRVDPNTETVWCGSGVSWQPVSDAAAAHGLAAQAGSAADVGVAGYLLSGGLSWLARRRGLAVNDVTRLEVVLADGSMHQVDHDHEPDLFWALRGGGGSFGIVTGIGLRLHRLLTVRAGTLFFPVTRAHDVLHSWLEWTARVPDRTMSCARLLNFPPVDDLPPILRGQAFAAVAVAHQGPADELDALVTPLRTLRPTLDTITDLPTARLSTLHMDPPGPTPARAHGMLLDSLPDAAIDTFIAAGGESSDSSLVAVDLRQLGGAVARRPDGAGAVGHFEAAFSLQAVGITPDPVTEVRVEQQAVQVRQAMTPWAAEVHYANFDEVASGGRTRFHDHATLQRLQSIKNQVDPGNLFTCGHPVADQS